ncbi:ABC transporter permease [Mycoplasmoides pirum]|uniref:ABC transporter permease n=1 Tax=Mycoplasmoides pirum TaxID=2122 RepID=UPI000697E530|nr:ABC transporter permease [Mycoplasmoides pirum]
MNNSNERKISQSIEINDESFKFVDIYRLNRVDQIVGKPSHYSIEILRRFFKNKWATGLLFLLLIIIFTAIIAPLVSPYDPYIPISNAGSLGSNLPPRLSLNDYPEVVIAGKQYLIDQYMNLPKGFLVKFEPISDLPGWFRITISPYHLDSLKDKISILGTDGGGIDIWTKLWTSVGISLGIALAIAVSATLIGVIYGSIAGSFAGRTVDIVMMRIVDIITGVPTLVWLIILGAVITGSSSGTISNVSIIPALIFVSWMSPANATRTYILKNKDAEYIQATRSLGGSQTRIIFMHMIPVVMGRLAVIFVNLIPLAIFYEASLVFIGLKSSTELGLGIMLNDAWQVTNSALIAAPIVTFSLITISAQIIANALNDSIDPRIIGRN